MSSTDVATRADHLVRVRALYPGAVGRGWAEGFKHQTSREVRRMEQRGEIIAIHRFAVENRMTGRITIPYVRMKERSQVRREQAIRIGVLGAAGLMFLTAVAWLAWESRYVIMIAAGMTALGALAFWLLPHFARGCPCFGCRCRG